MNIALSDSRAASPVKAEGAVRTFLRTIWNALGMANPKTIAANPSSMSEGTLARLVAHRIWAERNALDFEIVRPETVQRGLHSDPQHVLYRITLREGITVRIGENVVLISPDGEKQQLHWKTDHRIKTAWRAIQAIHMLNALGMEVDMAMNPNAILAVLDERICRIFERGDPPESTAIREVVTSVEVRDGGVVVREWGNSPSPWHELGNDLFLRTDFGIESLLDGYRSDRYHVMSERMGCIPMDPTRLRKTLMLRRKSSFARALGSAGPDPLPMAMPRGNAMATRIIDLCRKAVANDPGLQDVNGSPIEPLVNEHLPRLMLKHSQAVATARTDEIAGIDADLMTGLETVRTAVERALSISRSEKRDALRTELAFLEYRHPMPNPQLEVLQAG